MGGDTCLIEKEGQACSRRLRMVQGRRCNAGTGERMTRDADRGQISQDPLCHGQEFGLNLGDTDRKVL